VEFDKRFREEKQQLMSNGWSEEEAEKKSTLMEEVREMLRQWEAGNEEIISLWKTMNGWVYEGFEVTYKNMGVDFDKIYYESDTYLLGKEIVEEGIRKNIFQKKQDGSVRIDLTADGLDEKVVLRSDGTAVYITQDIGTAKLRFDDYHFSKMIYVVGNEQDYHFKVLKLITQRLGYEWSDAIYHLSYGMVDLPSGKMKSREGTVVDADELMDEMFSEAERITKELGKLDDFDSDEAKQLYKTIGLGALKYFLLRVDPEKRMMFNPAESIDFNGDTGPFIQYTYARIQSVLRKAKKTEGMNQFEKASFDEHYPINKEERELLIHLLQFGGIVSEAAAKLSPALIAHFAFAAARLFNHFYHQHSIVDADHLRASVFRLKLSAFTGKMIRSALHLLGIQVPDRM
jgi:arginyl-tRNA synthetase